MFSCPLHNWFSYDFPCPACQKQMTSTTEIIINAEGTNATDYHHSDKIKELQSLLESKTKECEELKERLKEYENNKRDPWDDLGKNLEETTF